MSVTVNLLLALASAALALTGTWPAVVAFNWFVCGWCTAFAVAIYVERGT